jgi:arsenate reductase (glutaredoxin)
LKKVLDMVIQIFGTVKCKETQKALRFFKERRIQPHFVDLNERAVSKGELENISRVFPLDELLDKEGKEYKKQNLEFMVYNLSEKLLEYPLLLKTPVTRFEKKVTLGYKPEIWKNWIS